MKCTLYFSDHVLRKRPYLKIEWCERIVLHPSYVIIQLDGRVRYWGAVPELNYKIIRVVTLQDGVTIHNAFLDSAFSKRFFKGEF